MMPTIITALLLGAVITTILTLTKEGNQPVALPTFNFLMWGLVIFAGTSVDVVLSDAITAQQDPVLVYGGLMMLMFSLLVLVVSILRWK